jgi:AraC family transcriptional regulator
MDNSEIRSTGDDPLPRIASDRAIPLGVGGTERQPWPPAFETEETGASSAALDDAPFDGVRVQTPSLTRRLIARWPGLSGEIVWIARRERFQAQYCGPFHLLIAYEGVVRQQGESTLGGVQQSTLRDLRHKHTFVPAGSMFREWLEPREPGRAIYLYLEARGPIWTHLASPASVELAPRLLFDNPVLRQTVCKLSSLIEAGPSAGALYAEALGVVLTHELLTLDQETSAGERPARGGLTGWQRRIVDGYLDQHLADQIPLTKLAELTQLSLYHFCRAFKQSFGMPPRRFHTSRRIERAKMLLTDPVLSVTNIALDVGFSGPSSFTVAFRSFTGRTPSEYRRSLV